MQDPDLTEKGVCQAESVAKFLKDGPETRLNGFDPQNRNGLGLRIYTVV